MPASMWRGPGTAPPTEALGPPRARGRGGGGGGAARGTPPASEAVAAEGGVVRLAVHLYPAPQELRDLDPAGRDGRAGFEEVVHESEPEALDAPGKVVLRERVDRVAHGVGGQEIGVVPVVVGGVEVAL